LPLCANGNYAPFLIGAKILQAACFDNKSDDIILQFILKQIY